jgi:FixJ family two-component response regulator
MGDANPIVLVIDDDPEFRDSVARLLRTVGLHTRQFSSVHDFLKTDPPGESIPRLRINSPARGGRAVLER